MEQVHGVDVSSFWNKTTSPRESRYLVQAKSPDSVKNAAAKPPSGASLSVKPPATTANATAPSEKATPATIEKPMTPDSAPSTPETPSAKNGGARRPASIARSVSSLSTSSVESNTSAKSGSSRKSWMASLSSKFGGSSQQSHNGNSSAGGPVKSPQPQSNGANPMDKITLADLARQQQAQTKVTTPTKQAPQENAEPYVPAQPKQNNAGFLSNALRRLSSSSQAPLAAKPVHNGGVCARRVMNVDRHRERCPLVELEGNKLRKVSFCVDVEIAGGPVYKDEVDTVDDGKKKNKKLKEKGEGAALKNPQAAADAKDKADETPEDALKQDPEASGQADNETAGVSSAEKKKSDEERRERAEKRRRKAEENGSIPKELGRDGQAITPDSTGTTTPRPQDRPTTDPLRIYRRCCQLRETPILKRITEQLGRPDACPVATPGVVSCLDLTGSRLQLADYYALSDWLAIVPLRRLIIEDADISDEGVRVVLAGLLAAKPPTEQRSLRKNTKQASSRPQFSSDDGDNWTHERLGIVEKLSLKNNPRLSSTAWKYISLFLYMCRSIKALDVSMNRFPNTDTADNNVAASPPPKTASVDLSEIFSKAISKRLAGNRFEELMMAECALSSHTVCKIVDAAVVCGVCRLGLAGNNLGQEGLEAVVRYLNSGICQGLDLAGNDLRVQLEQLVSGFRHDNQMWALSLADCNIDVKSLDTLLPALIKLPNLRFLDLSHNRDLFDKQPDALSLLREYIPQFPIMKRIHLCDVAMQPGQAIGLAEALPEAPHLAHLSLLHNPALTRLASATAEDDLEEACALYASLMSAARTSSTLMAIDIDVPTQETSEIVKALAKQIIAYCLRNMERWTSFDAMGDSAAGKLAADGPDPSQTLSPISKDYIKDIETPAVLMHLIGEIDGHVNRPGDDDPAPDEDYIVGGTGVVKALGYCLNGKACDMQRNGVSNDQLKADIDSGAKARKLGKDLLGSARKIRNRVRPAMIKEAKAGNDMAYRRLQFLDGTLQQTIDRFEAEYPELRLDNKTGDDAASQISSPSISRQASLTSSSVGDPNTPLSKQSSAVDESDDEDGKSQLRSRHASDVSLVSRAMGFEEGKVHRFGHQIRRDILQAPENGQIAGNNATSISEAAGDANPDGPQRSAAVMWQKLEQLEGAELRQMVMHLGWKEVMRQLGSNVEELKNLRDVAERGGFGSEEEADWRKFRQAQETAIKNAGL